MMSEASLSGSSVHLPAVIDKTASDVLGRRQACSTLGRLEWIFLVVSLCNILTCSGLTIERLVVYAQQQGSPDFTFALLLLISCVFCLFYVLNGLFREHQYEIYAFIAAIILVMAYCIFEYSFHPSGRTTIKMVRLIISCVLGPPNIVLAVYVARRFGWLQFRIIGASEALLQMYGQLKLFLSLQKMDLQATLSILILCLEQGTTVNLEDELTLSVGTAIAAVWFFLGIIAVQREVRFLVWAIAILGLLQPTYVLYMISKVYTGTYAPVTPDGTISPDHILKYSILGVGALSILVRVMLLGELALVYKNFGFGLKERAFSVLVTEHTSLLSNAQRSYS